ncbi:hypothetical protein Dimus_036834 [Dionaea muscipula]
MMLPFLRGLVGGGSRGVCEWLIREDSHMIVRRAVLFSLAAMGSSVGGGGFLLTSFWFGLGSRLCSCFLSVEGVIGVMPLVRMGLVRESQMGEVCGSFVCEGSSEDVSRRDFLGEGVSAE